ncbi:MAG: hypothetical protein HYT07_04010 [Candidatus Levybacteria bacterium]|nr:hypothetical protein [Candidatus Levybacteria bacterium]
MQSILLISESRKKAEEYVAKLLIHEKIDPIDISTNSFEKALGIEDVRNIQKKIFLKPLRSKSKAVVFEVYEGITTESQNALLKILEEPPKNTTIIIVANKITLFLPTILSRCKIIVLKENNIQLSKEDASLYLNILKSLEIGGVGERLKIAQDLTKNSENVIPWLEKMTLVVRQELIENYNDPRYLNLLKQFQNTFEVIKNTNVNKRIALENLFLSLWE